MEESPRNLPLILYSSNRKSWNVKQALEDNAWVEKVVLSYNFPLEHLTQFIELWFTLQNVQFDENSEDGISWKLVGNGECTAKLAYALQFMGPTLSIPLKSNFSIGFLRKREFGRWTNYKREGDQIVVYAPFASKLQSRFATSLSIVATPSGFGNLPRSG
jgi:hypothetical protein